MTLIVIMILLLLYRLYPEYEIYILLSGLLFLLYSNQIEYYQNQININRGWDKQGGITLPTMDNKHIKIKLSDDPVRNCYYKIKGSNKCKPFPSSPSMFNIDLDERVSSPGERQPLFFDFISPGSDQTQLYDPADNTIKIKSKVDFYVSDNSDFISSRNPGFSLSPIHKNQYGMVDKGKTHRKFRQNNYDIAPEGITDWNNEISYRSLVERPRRSRIIQDINGEITPYQGWSGSDNGKIAIPSPDSPDKEFTVDGFLGRIKSDGTNLITREIFNMSSPPSWYIDIIKMYVHNDGSTGYFLDSLNDPKYYEPLDDIFHATPSDIWSDDNNFKDGGKSDINEEDFSPSPSPYSIAITEKYKDIRLKKSNYDELYGNIVKFKIDEVSGEYKLRDPNGSPSPYIPLNDRHFIYDMLRLADKVNDEYNGDIVNDTRYQVLKIIEKTMKSKSLNNVGHGRWNPTETGYNTNEERIVGYGNIDGVYADDSCSSPIAEYIYFRDPSPSNNREDSLLCVKDNKVVYSINDHEDVTMDKLPDCYTIGVEGGEGAVSADTTDFNRGLYVKCFK